MAQFTVIARCSAINEMEVEAPTGEKAIRIAKDLLNEDEFEIDMKKVTWSAQRIEFEDDIEIS